MLKTSIAKCFIRNQKEVVLCCLGRSTDEFFLHDTPDPVEKLDDGLEPKLLEPGVALFSDIRGREAKSRSGKATVGRRSRVNADRILRSPRRLLSDDPSACQSGADPWRNVDL